MGKFDSLLFDMDGTLWDAVDSYAKVWNVTIDDLHVQCPAVTRQKLEELMGTPLAGIYAQLIGNEDIKEEFLAALAENERRLMPVLGGVLYEGVRQTIAELSRTTKLFMVSNCDASGVPNFLSYTGLGEYFTDFTTYGGTLCEKDVNIKALVERYKLQSPLYVGDTAGDAASSHRAGVPFAWAAYGFGKNVEDHEYILHSINGLIDICSCKK